jgi:hypothetical protein
MENLENNKYNRASQRVKELKDFFRHLMIFFAVNIVLYLFRFGVLQPYLPDELQLKPYYFTWVDIHLVIWLVILAVHTVYLFRYKFTFLRKWEERQIQKYMQKDEEELKKYK